MKTMSPFLALLLLVLSFSVNPPPLSSAASAPKPVLDTSGKIVRGGGIYYDLWPVYPTPGGLQLESLDGDKPCPDLDIVQEDQVPGLPVNFSPINDKKGVVRVSTDLNIQFPPASSTDKCAGSYHWWSVEVSPSTGKYFLTTGGEKGNPGPKTIRNWFKIEEYGRPGEYKLLYCPTFCKSCNVSCKYVGIIVQNGKRRLGLTDVPMKFVLK